jgi:hypothetical protein
MALPARCGHRPLLCLLCCACLQELWVDPLTRLPTLRHDLTIDRGMSFEAAAARLAHERGEQRRRACICQTGWADGAGGLCSPPKCLCRASSHHW